MTGLRPIPAVAGSEQVERAPHGAVGVAQLGHREYVGGLWDEIGRLQFDFLLLQGLEPRHALVDIACGALRAGVHLIPYLDVGNYLGIDKEPDLIRHGIEDELPADVRAGKRPELLVDGDFAFERFSRTADFALAQSLFSHLPPRHIERCLTKLRAWAPAHCRFFATYFLTTDEVRNADNAHDHLLWFYTPGQMRAMGRATGWDMTYIGEWNHPRSQVMVEYRPVR